ncbi:MAG: TlyA family RNA methyltransferase [Anaerolineae bacterium]|nr:TlyA family RNA methyltransferase [Anaerolineae bacterium]
MAKRVPRARLDVLLVERGLSESRAKAQRLIMANQVSVNGQLVDKPGTRVPSDAEIELTASLPYVSRGGLKLQAALDAFALRVEGLVVADVGASTGGFTDCLLQRGAQRVYAIDVGYGQLAWSLRQDARVHVLERTNARHLSALPEPIHLATVDVSFISLTLILPRVRDWLVPDGLVIPLIKPQFEAGREQVGKGGVVREAGVHRDVLRRVLRWADENGLPAQGLIRSPISGPAGNAEFLAMLRKTTIPSPLSLEQAIQDVL